MREKGLFIVFEGVDGVGKTTLAKHMAEEFHRRGQSVLLTKEPFDGTIEGKALREIIVNGNLDPLTKVMLVEAARIEHRRKIIDPALKRGEVVICDRYVTSTHAYDGCTYENLFYQNLIFTALKTDLQIDHLFYVTASEATSFNRLMLRNTEMNKLDFLNEKEKASIKGRFINKINEIKSNVVSFSQEWEGLRGEPQRLHEIENEGDITDVLEKINKFVEKEVQLLQPS